MTLRFASPVSSTDGPFGEVADVVIDPITRTITHVVVEPHRRHSQARLVPVELLDLDTDPIVIRLDAAHVRALPTVADSDFVRFGDSVDIGEGWDVGIEHVVALPYAEGPMGVGAWADAYGMSTGVTVDYDRIPKGDCEIRRESSVVSSDGHLLGVVEGFLADDTHIEGVIIQTGWPGFRHLVVVPIGTVERVANDRIELGLDRETFRCLRPVDEFAGPHVPSNRFERLEHSAAVGLRQVRSRVRTLMHRGDS